MTFRRSFATHSLLVFSFAAPLFASRPAFADEACGDQVCPKGFQCETYDLGCPAIDCAEGSECAPCEAGTESVCVPSPCTSNADCAADMQCVTQTYEMCEGAGGCARPDPADGAEVPPDCVGAEPTNCTTVSTSSCVPRWALPCQLASDCGPGFTCEELMEGSCPGSTGSGGGSTPADGSSPGTPTPDPADGGAGEADPGFAPPPDERPGTDGGTDDGCVFEPSGEFACVRIEVACQSDADCLEGWSCDDNREGVCWSSSDGSTGCDPVDPPKLCYPPYEEFGGRGIAEGDSETGDDGGSVGGPSGEPAPATPSADTATDNDSETSTVRTSGCAVSPAATGGAGFGFLALALAGLLGARRRR